MVKRRKLTPVEISLNLKGIRYENDLLEELEEYSKPYLDFRNKTFEIKHKLQKKKDKEQLDRQTKEVDDAIKLSKQKIKILQDQIDNGAEPKEQEESPAGVGQNMVLDKATISFETDKVSAVYIDLERNKINIKQ